MLSTPYALKRWPPIFKRVVGNHVRATMWKSEQPMTKKYRQLASAITRVKSAPSARMMYAAAKEMSGTLGYTHLMIAHAPGDGRTLEESLMYSDARKHVIRDLDKRMPYSNFHLVAKSRASQQPFTIRELQQENGNTEIGFGLPDHLKSGDNVLVPVHDETKLAGLAMFSGHSGDLSPVVKSMLCVLTYNVFKSYQGLACREGDALAEECSDREIICLSYLGRGMGDDEISSLLGISKRTVRFHVDNVKLKLGASSRMQAVAIAIQKRLISV